MKYLIVIKFVASHHRHQCRVAGGDRCVAPTAWPRRMARLLSSTGELLESRWIWSIHLARGLPGRRLQLGPEGRPTDKLMCLRCAICAGTSLSSRAMCPNTEMRRIGRISSNGTRHGVRACTSTSNQRIPSIWRWHFMWKASNAFMSVARKVQVSAAYQ